MKNVKKVQPMRKAKTSQARTPASFRSISGASHNNNLQAQAAMIPAGEAEVLKPNSIRSPTAQIMSQAQTIKPQ